MKIQKDAVLAFSIWFLALFLLIAFIVATSRGGYSKPEIVIDERNNAVYVVIDDKSMLTVDAQAVHFPKIVSQNRTPTGGSDGHSKPEIVIDEENDAVDVMIRGKDVLTVNAKGIYTSSMLYTGQLSGGGDGHSKPEIVIDEKNDAVHVMIGGKDMLTVDSIGMHAPQFAYGG